MKLELRTAISVFRAWLDRQPRYAVAGGAGLLLLLAWVMYVPPWMAIQKLKQRQNSLQAEMKSATAVLEEVRAGGIQPPIPMDQAPEVLARLEALAQENGLRFLQVSPGQARPGDPGQPRFLPVDLQVEGPYRSLGEFLGRLSDPGAMPASVLVRRLQISRNEKLLPRLQAQISMEIAFSGGGNVSAE